MVLSLSAYSQVVITKQLVDSLANTLVIKKAQDLKIAKMDSVIQLQAHIDSVQTGQIKMYQQDGVDYNLALTRQEKIISNQKEDLKVAGNEIKKAGIRGIAIGTVLGSALVYLLILMTQ